MTIKCPVCGKKTTWEENPARPFCSERCRIIDLGNWASDKYVIEGGADDKSNADDDEAETA